MTVTAQRGRYAVVQIGASASALKSYVLVPNSIGNYIRRPLSEHFAPIRLGPPDYDSRAVASTIPFVDFAGGLGRYYPDSRNEASRAWNAVADTRFSGQVTLLPMFTGATPASTPSGTGGAGALLYSNVHGLDSTFLAAGDRLYRHTAGAWANVIQLAAGAARETYKLRERPGAITFLFWARDDGLYSANADPTNVLNWQGPYSTPAPVVTPVSDVALHPSSQLWLGSDAAAPTIWVITPGTAASMINGGQSGPGGHFIGPLLGNLYQIDNNGLLWEISWTAGVTHTTKVVETLQRLVTGCVYSGQLALTDGRRVVLWHPTRPSREITPGLPDGLPDNLAVVIRHLYAIGDRLVAVCDGANGGHFIFEFRGGGWHVLTYKSTTTWYGETGVADLRNMAGTGLSYDPTSRRVWLSGKLIAGSAPTTFYNTLPVGGENPYVQEQIRAGDGFEGTGEVETGWHYLGLKGLSGPLLQVRALGEFVDTNVSVVVSYRVNDDDTAAWTPLGTLTSTTRTLTFGSGAGVSFRSVRFKLALSQTGGGGGGVSTKSPNAAFAVEFAKVPDQLEGKVFTVDVARTARLTKRKPAQIYSDLVTLAEQKTLATVITADEGTLYLKLQAPQLSGYLSKDGRQMGTLQISASELV